MATNTKKGELRKESESDDWGDRDGTQKKLKAAKKTKESTLGIDISFSGRMLCG